MIVIFPFALCLEEKKGVKIVGSLALRLIQTDTVYYLHGRSLLSFISRRTSLFTVFSSLGNDYFDLTDALGGGGNGK